MTTAVLKVVKQTDEILFETEVNQYLESGFQILSVDSQVMQSSELACEMVYVCMMFKPVILEGPN